MMSRAGALEGIACALIVTPCAAAYSIAAVNAGGGSGPCACVAGVSPPAAPPCCPISASTRGGGSSLGSLAAIAIAISGATPSGFATATRTPRLCVVVIA